MVPLATTILFFSRTLLPPEASRWMLLACNDSGLVPLVVFSWRLERLVAKRRQLCRFKPFTVELFIAVFNQSSSVDCHVEYFLLLAVRGCLLPWGVDIRLSFPFLVSFTGVCPESFFGWIEAAATCIQYSLRLIVGVSFLGVSRH